MTREHLFLTGKTPQPQGGQIDGQVVVEFLSVHLAMVLSTETTANVGTPSCQTEPQIGTFDKTRVTLRLVSLSAVDFFPAEGR